MKSNSASFFGDTRYLLHANSHEIKAVSKINTYENLNDYPFSHLFAYSVCKTCKGCSGNNIKCIYHSKSREMSTCACDGTLLAAAVRMKKSLHSTEIA